jgi:hypothetical protein
VARARGPNENLPNGYEVAVTNNDMGLRSREPDAECSNCQRRMVPMDCRPIAGTDRLVDVTYVCEWCGRKTKRAVWAGKQLAHLPHVHPATEQPVGPCGKAEMF